MPSRVIHHTHSPPLLSIWKITIFQEIAFLSRSFFTQELMASVAAEDRHLYNWWAFSWRNFACKSVLCESRRRHMSDVSDARAGEPKLLASLPFCSPPPPLRFLLAYGHRRRSCFLLSRLKSLFRCHTSYAYVRRQCQLDWDSLPSKGRQAFDALSPLALSFGKRAEPARRPYRNRPAPANLLLHVITCD